MSREQFDTATRLRKIFGVSTRELLTTHDIARDYKFPSPEAVRQYLRRKAAAGQDVPFQMRGRILLIDRRDFEASFTSARERRLAQQESA